MKQLILAFSVLVTFLCGQTSAGARAVAVSDHTGFVKSSDKVSSKELLVNKLKPAGKDTQHPLFPKKKRNKCLQQEFLACAFNEVQFNSQAIPTNPPFHFQSNCLSVQFLPNGKRGPPALA